MNIFHSARLTLLALGCIIGAGSLAHGQPQPLLIDAETEGLSGLYFPSIQTYGQQVELSPKASWVPWAEMQIAKSALYLNRYAQTESALDALLAAHSTSPYQPEAWLLRGLLALQRRDYGQARLALNEAIHYATESTERTPQPDVAGEAMYWVGISHIVEPGTPLLDRATQALASSVDEYPNNPKAPDGLFALGQVFEQRGNITAALEQYTRLLEHYPQSDLALPAGIRASQAMLLLHNYSDALAQLDLSQKDLVATSDERLNNADREEFDAELNMVRGTANVGLKDYPAAERSWLHVAYQPESKFRRPALLGLANTYRAAGRYDSALAIYGNLVKENVADDASSEASFQRALVLRAVGHDAEAINALREISTDTTNRYAGEAQIELGIVSYSQKEYAAAEGELMSAVSASTTGTVTRLKSRAELLLAMAQLAQGKAAAAADNFELAEKHASAISPLLMPERDSVLALAYYMHGIALTRAARPTEAVPILNKFLQNYPKRSEAADATYWLGAAYYNAQLYPLTVQTLEDMIEKYPGSKRVEDALFTIGWAQFRQQHLERAESAFGRLVKAYPLGVYANEAQMRRADCYFMLQKYADAAALYTAVAKEAKTPDELRYATYQAGLCHYHGNELESALREFARIGKEFPDVSFAPDALFMYGQIQYNLGHDREAAQSLNRLIENYERSPLVPRAYFALANAYYRMGQNEAALAAYSIIPDKYPGSAFVADARTGAERAMQNLIGSSGTATADREVSQRFGNAALLFDGGKYMQAIAQYRPLTTNRDSSVAARAWTGIARSYMQFGDTTRAMDTLQWLANNYPETPQAPSAIATVADISLFRRDTVATLSLLDHLRSRYSHSEEAQTAANQEIAIYLAERKYGEARNVLTESDSRLQNDSLLARAWLRIGEWDETAERFDSARTSYMRVANGNDLLAPEALFRIAGTLRKEKNYPAAIATYSTILERYPGRLEWTGPAYLETGDTYEAAGDTEKAKQVYQQILQGHQTEDIVKKAEERLQGASGL